MPAGTKWDFRVTCRECTEGDGFSSLHDQCNSTTYREPEKAVQISETKHTQCKKHPTHEVSE